ncbi:MAG: hypothetical protein R3D55_12710 [Chloroflexota bacterium]
MDEKNETAVFLHPTYTWNRASLELVDVQPLHGGVRVLLPSFTSAEAYVSQFAPGGTETKYRIPLNWTENEKQQLIQLCLEQNFLTIEPEMRLGIPDEARPSLTLQNHQREKHTVAKWAGVQDERFDAIYQAMLGIAARTEGARPFPQRFAPWQKAATVAGIGLGVLLLGLVGYGLARPFVTALWPDRFGLLLVLLLHLIAFVLAGLVGLAWRERRKSRWERAYTHLWTMSAVNLCLFLAGVGAWGLAETAVATWRDLASPTSEQMWYPVLGYAGVITAVLLLALAKPTIPRLLTLIDERF